jgi:O-antigen ligase
MKRGFRFFALSPEIERRLFLFLSCAVAFSIPFEAIYNSVSCITLFVFWLLFMEKKVEAQKVQTILMISALFWIALIGMAYTVDVEEGLFRLQQKALLVVLPIVFGTITEDRKMEYKWIVTAFVVGVVMACLASLLRGLVFFLQHDSARRFFSHDLAGFVDLYPYIFALLCLSALLILAESMMGEIQLHPFLRSPIFKSALIFFLAIFILLLSVKQIIFALVIFIFIYAVRANRKFVFVLTIIGFAIIAASIFFIPILNYRFKEAIAEQKEENPLNQNPETGTALNGIALRRALWVCAVDAIEKNPVLGVGTGDGQDALQIAYVHRKFVLASQFNKFNAHNQYLQVLIAHGIIGIAIWLLSFFWLIKKNRINKLLIYLISALLFAMLTESMLETNKGDLAMAFLLTIFSFMPTYNSITVSNSN